MAILTYWTVLLLVTWNSHGLSFLLDKPIKEDQSIPLSKAGEDIIRDVLSQTTETILKSENQQLNLRCKNKATNYLLNEYPNSKIRWKHNSKNFVLQPSRMTYQLSSVFIQSLRTEDTGVFSCQVDVSSTRHYVVGVHVVVVGRSPLHVLPGDSVTLDCNSKQLGIVYKDAVGIWEHNGKAVRNSKKPAINAENALTNVNTNVTGDWACKVYGKFLPIIWTTASYRVTLAPVPPLLTKIRVYVKNNRLTSVLIFMGGAFIVVMFTNLLMSLLERKERAKRKEIEQLRKMLGIGPNDTEALIDDTMPLLQKDEVELYDD